MKLEWIGPYARHRLPTIPYYYRAWWADSMITIDTHAHFYSSPKKCNPPLDAAAAEQHVLDANIRSNHHPEDYNGSAEGFL